MLAIDQTINKMDTANRPNVKNFAGNKIESENYRPITRGCRKNSQE